MRLVVLGGGGFRVPLVYGALLDDTSARRVTEVVLHDTDAARLAVVAHVLHAAGSGRAGAPTVTVSTDLDTALAGADVVFSAIRVGGLEGRTVDERLALDLGVLGQETTGAGGVGYALRTVPVALHVARRVRALASDAWVINFTNPAGLVTQAMQSVLGDRVIGICDSPLGLARRAAGALGPGPRTPRHRLCRAQPPRLAPRAVARHPQPAARPPLGQEQALLDGGGSPLRHRVAAFARRAAQRVPLLLLLHPRGDRRDPGG